MAEKKRLPESKKVGSVFLSLFFLLLIPRIMLAQPPLPRLNSYIESYSEEAVKQMVEFHIPASVILAQAIFESRCGTSELARKSNNHFGIKCHIQWTGDTVIKTDDTLNECFRRYRSIADSYTDHSMFLRSRPRYSHLFALPISDYKGWCRGLKIAGYATFPGYAEELIRIIESQGLTEFDRNENLQPRSTILFPGKEVRPSRFFSHLFTLQDFCRADLLWADENDIHIRSLDLVVEQTEEEGDIAEK